MIVYFRSCRLHASSLKIGLNDPEWGRPQVQLESERGETLPDLVSDETRLVVGPDGGHRLYSARFEREPVELEDFGFRRFGAVDLASRRSGTADRQVALLEESVQERSNHVKVGFIWEESGTGKEVVQRRRDIDGVYVASDDRETAPRKARTTEVSDCKDREDRIDTTHGIQIRLSTPHRRIVNALSIAMIAYSRIFGSWRSYS